MIYVDCTCHFTCSLYINYYGPAAPMPVVVFIKHFYLLAMQREHRISDQFTVHKDANIHHYMQYFCGIAIMCVFYMGTACIDDDIMIRRHSE